MLSATSRLATFLEWFAAIGLTTAVIAFLLWAATQAFGPSRRREVYVMTAGGAGASVFTLVLALF